MNEEITWGDTVKISPNAPAEYRPEEVAAVCGIRIVSGPEEVKATGVPDGTKLYLVEFGDGNSQEIPEYLISKIGDTTV